MSYSEQCLTCKHFLGTGQCVAFPEGIPDEIFTGEFDHRQLYEGDDGVRWEQDAAMGAAPIEACDDERRPFSEPPRF